MNQTTKKISYFEWLPRALLFLALMILMATLCMSGFLKASLTSALAPVPSTLLTVYLAVSSSGKVSSVSSLLMNTKTFLLTPAKQISALFSSGQMECLPTLWPLTQVPETAGG